MKSLVARIKNWWGEPSKTPTSISTRLNGKLVLIEGKKVTVDGVPYAPGGKGGQDFSQNSYISITLEGVEITLTKEGLFVNKVQYAPETQKEA